MDTDESHKAYVVVSWGSANGAVSDTAKAVSKELSNVVIVHITNMAAADHKVIRGTFKVATSEDGDASRTTVTFDGYLKDSGALVEFGRSISTTFGIDGLAIDFIPEDGNASTWTWERDGSARRQTRCGSDNEGERP